MLSDRGKSVVEIYTQRHGHGLGNIGIRGAVIAYFLHVEYYWGNKLFLKAPSGYKQTSLTKIEEFLTSEGPAYAAVANMLWPGYFSVSVFRDDHAGGLYGWNLSGVRVEPGMVHEIDFTRTHSWPRIG